MGSPQTGMKRPKMGKPKLRVIGESESPSQLSPSERDYFTQLHKLIDDIFARAADEFEWTWSQLASHANLGYGTVDKLGNRHTKFPRFQTVFKLAEAVGWKLVTHEGKKKKSGGAAAKVKVAVG